MELRVQYLKRRTLFGFSNRRILYRHYLMDGRAHTIVSKIIYLSLPCFGSKGWRSGESAWCGPGSNPGVDAICGLSLLMVLSFAPRGFSGYSGFPLSSKTNNSKFQFDQESGRQRTTLWTCYLQVIICLSFIYFYQMTLNKISTSFLWALNNFFSTIIYVFSLVLSVITHYVIKL